MAFGRKLDHEEMEKFTIGRVGPNRTFANGRSFYDLGLESSMLCFKPGFFQL